MKTSVINEEKVTPELVGNSYLLMRTAKIQKLERMQQRNRTKKLKTLKTINNNNSTQRSSMLQGCCDDFDLNTPQL